MNSPQRYALLALVAVAAACAGDDSSRQVSTTRDSAGVTIVESTGASWEEDARWTISAEPQLDIGVAEGAPEYQLYRALSAVRLSDSRIVVANGGTNELRFYDSAGSHLMSVGRTGEGPGEFRDLQRVWLLPGDSLLAYDFFPSRLSVFTSSGAFIRSQHFASSDGRQILIRGPLSDGSVIAAGAPIWNAPGATSGVVRDSVPYYRYDATGALIGTLGRFPSIEVYRIVTADDWRLTSVPFPRAPVAAITGSRFHFGPADSYELRTYTPAGELERVVRLAQPARAVEPADIDEYRRERLDRAEREGTRPAMERILSEVPFPQTLPPYDQAIADADGNLWVADYRTVRQGAASWNVFSAAGELMGSVATPARFEVLQIGTDFILGQWLDDMEVEHIRLFALNKP